MIDFKERISEKTMFFFLLPLLLSGVFQQIFTPYSTAIAARYLPEYSLAVVGALGAYKSVQDAIFVGMTTGFSFCVNRAAGDQDPGRYVRVFREALYLTGGLWIVSILLSMFPEPILFLSNVPEEIIEEAGKYLPFLLLAGGFWGIENLLLCVVQGTGDTKFPSAAVVCATVFQLLILWMLLDVFGLGIEAVSISILSYHLLLCLLLGGYLFRTSLGKELRTCLFAKEPFKNRTVDFSELLRSGMAKVSMMLMVSLGFFIMQRRVNQLSLDYLAGYAHASSLNAFLQQPLCVYATAGGIISARTIGEKKKELFQFYNRRLLIYSAIWSLFFFLTVIPAAPALIRMMAGEQAGTSVIEAGVFWIRIAAVSYFLLALLMISRNALQAMGHYRILLLLGFLEMSVNLVFGWVCIPLWGYAAYCISTVFRWGVPAIAGYLAYRRRVRLE